MGRNYDADSFGVIDLRRSWRGAAETELADRRRPAGAGALVECFLLKKSNKDFPVLSLRCQLRDPQSVTIGLSNPVPSHPKEPC